MKFTLKEVLAVNGHSVESVPESIKTNLERLLEKVNKIGFERPMTCTSGYRTPEYNKIVGGAKNSPHTQGRAIDIFDPDGSLKKFILENNLLEKLDLRMESPLDAPTWCHLDDYPVKTNRVFRV